MAFGCSGRVLVVAPRRLPVCHLRQFQGPRGGPDQTLRGLRNSSVDDPRAAPGGRAHPTTRPRSGGAECAWRVGQDRLHHYRIAAGSAGEIRSHLAVALAWGDVDQATVTPALALLDSILAMPWRLTHP